LQRERERKRKRKRKRKDLIAKSMPSDHNRHFPTRNKERDILADNGLAKHGSPNNVADGSVGRPPHLLQFELLHSRLVWGDGGALDSHVVFFDGIGSINCDLRDSSCRVSQFKNKSFLLSIHMFISQLG